MTTLSGGVRRATATAAVLTGAMLWLGVGSGAALAAAPSFGMENVATQLCGSSGSGAPGTIVRQQSCAEYSSHDGSYQEYWATADMVPGVKLEAFHEYNGQRMCMTVRNGALAVGTPLVMEPCGGAIALGQQFDELGAVGGTLLHAYAESGRKVDDPRHLSPFCVAGTGGVGTALVLQRCDNRLASQAWTGLTDEGSPGLPAPADPTK